ncbi:MipA/OmpV family protein [Brevundimonas intermedia]|uniref:MipA/OmpV family protein n=1 Tax=Brevundimonas intermedia TaxID=74315 RepID=UPI003208064E
MQPEQTAMLSRHFLTSVFALATMAAAQPAMAQSGSGGNDRVFIIGGGAAYRPEYKGADDYEVQPFPYFSVRYPISGMTLSLQGAALKLEVLASDTFSAGPLISYQQGRDDDITNPVVRQLSTIDGAVEGGGYLDFETPIGPGSFSAGVIALSDLSGVHEGYSVALNAGYRMPVTSKLSVGVGAEVKWADENYMQTYYGVDLPGAFASGLPSYAAEAGLEKAGVNVNLIYQLTERWGVGVFGGYDKLLDSAADSPIVVQEGSPDQYTGALAVFYRF